MSETLEDLVKVVEELKTRLNQQEQELTRLRASANQPPVRPAEKPTSRRRMLKKLAAGAALATAASAAWVAGEAPIASASTTTGSTGTPGTANNTFGFSAAPGNYTNYAPSSTNKFFGLIGTTDPAANVPPELGSIAGVFGSSVNGNGVQARSSTTHGIWGQTDANSVAGVYGLNSKTSGTSYGVLGRSLSASGSGVNGDNTAAGDGVRGTSSAGGNGVRGIANGSELSNGVYGSSDSGQGVFGEANGVGAYGVLAQGTAAGTYGLVAQYVGPTGNGAPIWIPPGSGGAGKGGARAGAKPAAGAAPFGPPTANPHNAGEIVSDSRARLFYCTTTGTPGTWGQLAPVVYLTSPVRLYGNPYYPPDLSVPASNYSVTPPVFSPIYLAIEGSWTNGSNSAVIPNNATAIIGTVVAYNAPALGFLAIYPADITPPTIATLVYSTGFTSSTIQVRVGPIPAGDPNATKLGVGLVSSQPIKITFDVIAYLL